MELAERVVAPDAEQAADLARLVVVVDVERDLPGLLPADRASAALPHEERLVVGLGDPERAAEVPSRICRRVPIVRW